MCVSGITRKSLHYLQQEQLRMTLEQEVTCGADREKERRGKEREDLTSFTSVYH